MDLKKVCICAFFLNAFFADSLNNFLSGPLAVPTFSLFLQINFSALSKFRCCVSESPPSPL